MAKTDHLALAKEDLAIAESSDSKHEAYRRAAREIAAHKVETGATWNDIAVSLGQSEVGLRKLDQWRREGFKTETPYLMDKEESSNERKT